MNVLSKGTELELGGRSGKPAGKTGVGAAAGAVMGLTGLRTEARKGSAAPAPTATYVNNGERKTGVLDLSDPYWNAMREHYDRMYDSAAEEAEAAAEEASLRAEQAAETERERLNEGYRGMNRQLYRDYMESRRVLPQRQAAMGYSGGLTESGLIRLQNAYGENLAVNERARLSAIAQADENLAQRQYEARAEAAKTASQAHRDRYAQIAALRQQQYQQQRSDQQARAALLAGAGDYSGYGDLGYSQEDIDYLAQMWRAKNPKLADFQATGQGSETVASDPEELSAMRTARQIQKERGTDEAVAYVAGELARGRLFSDEAKRIYDALKQN